MHETNLTTNFIKYETKSNCNMVWWWMETTR